MSVKAQDKTDSVILPVRTVTDLKSGNWQNILTSFFQFGANDLTGNNHSFAFKATLLGIKAKLDSTLLFDKNYVHQKKARNFQFNFALQLDTSYQFSGFNGGFTYAIINNRDLSEVTLPNMYSDGLNQKIANIDESFLSYLKKNKLPDTANYLKITKQIDSMRHHGKFYFNNLPKAFLDFVHSCGDTSELSQLLAKSDSAFNNNIQKILRKTLFTFTTFVAFDKANFLNEGFAQLHWLKGIKLAGSGLVWKADMDATLSGDIKDSAADAGKMKRGLYDAQVGINFMICKNGKSIFEFKPNIEDQLLFVDKAHHNVFYASADMNIRIFQNLWLPFTLKYDTHSGKFLGSLNVALNFNLLKSYLNN